MMGQSKYQLNLYVNELEDYFESLDQLLQPVKIHVKNRIMSGQKSPRTLPVEFTGATVNHVKDVEVIKELGHPTEWITNQVTVHRPGRKLRVVASQHSRNEII